MSEAQREGEGTLGTLGRWFAVARAAPYTLKPGGDKALDQTASFLRLRGVLADLRGAPGARSFTRVALADAATL